MRNHIAIALSLSLLLSSASLQAASPTPAASGGPAAAGGSAATGGSATVELLEASGAPATASGRLLQTGDRVRAGDRLEVPVGQSVRLTLADGSEITAARGARVDVGPITDGPAGAKSADLTLVMGIVHVAATPGYTHAKPFRVHTATAVMGVRGTEFVVEQSPGGPNAPAASTLYTLEGSVALARTEAALASGRGAVLVGAGRTSTVDATMAAPRQPSRINRKSFAEHFDKQAPEVSRQIQRTREARHARNGKRARKEEPEGRKHKPLKPPHPRRRQLKKP